MKHLYRIGLLFLGMFVLTNVSFGQVFITEIADPNNNAGARYIELYNAGASAVDLTGYQIRIYFNANATPGATNTLAGTIPAGGFYIVADNNSTFTSVFGFAADEDGSVNSNGDDNFELLDASMTIIDVFGVPGEDGTGTDHEFEDGRAERAETVTSGNTTYTAAEWNIDHDSGGGDGAQDAPGVYDPGDWIGVPDLTAPTFTSGPTSGSITGNGFQVTAQADEEATLYYVIDDAGTPTAQEIKDGQLSGGASATFAGSVAVTAASTDATVTISGLTGATAYDVHLALEDGAGNLSAVSTLTDVTTAATDNTAPTVAAPAALNILDTQFDINFQQNELGTIYYIVHTASSTPSADDVKAGRFDGSSSAFASGTIDVTLADTDFPVTVSGLTASTTYFIYAVGEDDETTPNTSAVTAEVSQATAAAKDTDSDILAATAAITASTISSLADTEGEAVAVFNFKINDSGTGDGLPTAVETVVITPATNNTAAWSSTIAGAKLNDGSDITDNGVTITDSDITVDLSTAAYSVTDGGESDVSLMIWLNTAVNDGEVLAFEIANATTTFTTSAASSAFADPVTGETGADHTIGVSATDYAFSAQEYGAYVSTDFAVTVQAVDANGNLDIDNTDAITVAKNSGSGALSSIGGLTPSLVAGEVAISDLQFDAAGIHTLTVSGALTSDNSDNISILESGSLVLNEVHADPSNSGTDGDANGDGVGDFSDDEFFELVYTGSVDIDLSNWTMSDGSSERHVFAASTTITPNSALVVFGGGTPTGTFGGATVLTSSTGSISLNNGGDDVIINAGGVTDILNVTYPSAGNNQSISLDPDLTGSFAEHSTIVEAGGALYSPGTKVDGSIFCDPPATQASAFTFMTIGETVMTVNWTRGSGDEVLVVAKSGSAVDADPASGTTYSANAAFGTGDQIGTGNYVVYAGTGTSVPLTGLTQGTVYHFAAYEYSTADNCYNLVELTGSQSTATPNDSNTDITALSSPIAQTDISSLIDTDAEAVDVFGFTVTDEGTDGQATNIDGIEISAGTNNTADWSATIAGAVLNDGTTDHAMTIAAGSLTLDLSGTEFVLANGTSQEFTLSIWFNTSVTDGEVLEFEIPTSHNFSAISSGSVFLATLAGAVTSAQHTVDVTATALVLDYPSAVAIAEDFALTVTAEDANGNADSEARNVSITKTSGSGDLTGTGLTGQAMTDGAFTWSDLQLSTADSYVLTVDDDGSALTADANIDAQVVVNQAAQLLISEVVVTPTGSEYVEIYNNSGTAVLLDDYYLTDATFAGGSTYYYNIVTGTNAGGGGFGDWHARFPAGSIIADGEVQTISLAGSDDFFAAYGIEPTYELYEDGASADAVPDMLEAIAGSINDQGGLTDGGEIVMLYYWDGNTDLVTDIDYVMWGDQAEAIDKTGISIDGPDGDTDATTYLDDLATASQAIISASTHASGNSWQRSDFDEGTETQTGGNGVDGHNEMTEDLANTFIENTANPGEIIEPGTPLITLTTTSFNGSFGFVELGQSSDPSSYDVEGADLTSDVVITPPEGFEIAAEMDFSGTVYTNASPWTVTQTGGVVSQTVYVRFTPLATDAVYSGDISHTSTGAETKNVTVSGTEGVFDTAPNISGVVINEILPDPNFTGTEGYDTDGSGAANTEDEFVELYNTSASAVDISGWQLWDESGMFFEFPATTTLGAGNYVGVMAEVQEGGTLPTPSTGNLAFEVAGTMSLSNSGENVALYDPNSGEYIQIKYGDGESDANIGANLSGATLNGIIEAWGGDEDGSSLVREPAGDLNIVVHSEIEGAAAASFAEPTIDASAPFISIDDASFNPNFGNVEVGEESATSTYSVSGTNLEADIVIMAPDNFEISQDGSTFSSSITLSPTANEVSATTITVKYVPSAEGSEDGTISHTSTNAVNNDIDVSGAGITDATIFFEGFGTCDALNGFDAQSVIGDEAWDCTDFGETGSGVRMSGFNSGVQDNEDWLVTPGIDLSSIAAADLSFDTDVQFPALDLEVFVSTDYTNDVTTATWTELDVTLDDDEASDTWTNSGLISLPAGSMVYVAFKYESNTTDGAASWTLDNVKVTETEPFFAVEDDSFNGDFGQQDVGTNSVSGSFTVEGFGLTNDVTVTPPAQFEVSMNSNFNNAGTSSSPLTITVTDGTVDQEVFVRFSPSAAGSFSGNVTVSSDPFETVTLAVSGVGEEDDDTTLGLDDELEIVVYPNPVQDAFEISNKTGKKISVELFALDGAKMKFARSGDVYSIASLNSGVYVLVVKDEDSNELARQQIIKQ
ncbi:lamin tail domain-containing protein [Ekhidna sp.]